MRALTTRALRTRLFLGRRLRSRCRRRTDAAEVIDDRPDLLLGQRALLTHHPRILGFAPSGGSAIPDHGEDFAIAAAVVPLRVRQVGRFGIPRSQRAVALPAEAMAMPAILVVESPAGGNRRRIGRNRILPRGQL